MQSKNQYLRVLRKEYLKTKSKKEKDKLLNEAEKRTGLDRKYLVRKSRPKSNLDKTPGMRKKRKPTYGGYVKAALVKCWKIFDHPCGQRLKSSLEIEADRLRKFSELKCSDEVACKLKAISSSTIDTLLVHQKEVKHLKRKYKQKTNPLLYHKIPVKLANKWDRNKIDNIQIDLVEHCGRKAAGDFLNTLSNTDIATGWWEGEIVMGRGQLRIFNRLCLTRD